MRITGGACHSSLRLGRWLHLEELVSQRNKDIVEKVNASFAANNLEGFLSHCTDDIVWTMVGEKPVNGKDAIREWISSMPMDPPVFDVATLIGEGDIVMAHGDMTMTDKDRKTTAYSYCDVYHFRGDKIVELKSFVIKTDAVAAA